MAPTKRGVKAAVEAEAVKTAAVKAEVKPAAPVKEEVKAEEKKAAPAAKTAAKTTKTTAAKTTAAKKAAPAKTAAKKAAEPKATVHIQFGGDKDVIAKDILDKAVKAYKAAHKGVEVKDIQLYIVPEQNCAYYVVNGEEAENNRVEL